MKTLLATVALAAVVASPALAQNWTQRQVRDPYGAYAAPYAYSNGYDIQRRAPRRAFSVYDTQGNFIGSDPDPSVRDQLARDPSQGD